MRYIRKSGNEIVKQPRLHRISLAVVLLAYLAFALPLPFVLLDHELGLVTGTPAHTVQDIHAWLDHAAGVGITAGEIVTQLVDLADPVGPPVDAYHEAVGVHAPSGRGPPPSISLISPSVKQDRCGVVRNSARAGCARV